MQIETYITDAISSFLYAYSYKKTYGNSSLSVKIVVLTIDKTSELLFLANCSSQLLLLTQV